MPTVTVHRVIHAPQEEVWAAIADIENAGRWNHAWQCIEFLSGQREGVGTAFRAQTEEGHAFDFEVVAWEPPHYIEFAPQPETSGADSYPIILESQAFYLRPTAEGQTELALTATASTRGLRGWLLGRLVWPGYQKQGLRRALEAVAALFEAEEEQTETKDS